MPTDDLPGTTLLRRARSAWVVLPAIVLGVLGVLVALGINGSSVALLAPHTTHDSSLLAGTPRPVRADEFMLSTPIVVGNVRRGAPDRPWIGLSPTFLPATALEAPTTSWTEIFKPQDWGLFVSLTRGFALHWWWQLGIAVLGLYLLLGALTRRPWLSAGLAVVAATSPYVAWWSLTPGLILGYMAGATGLAVLALRARRTLHMVLLALAGGYAAAAAFLLLYPPWQVSIAWVSLGLLAGVAVDSRVRLRRIGATAACAAVVLVPTLAVWFLQSRTALSATAGTYYPGGRLSGGGGGTLAWLLDAPANPWMASVARLTGDAVTGSGAVIHANPSETAASWLPLPIVVLIVAAVLVAAWRSRRQSLASERSETAEASETAETAEAGETAATAEASETAAAAEASETAAAAAAPPLTWTTVGATLSLLVLLAWTLVPLPSWFGRVTLLDRVPGVRTSLAIGLAAIVLLAIGSTVLARSRWSWRWVVLGAAIVALTTWSTTWAGRAIPWEPIDHTPHMLLLLLVSGVFAAGFGLLLWRPAVPVAVAVLVVGSLASFVLVNPWYRGLGPLVRDPLVRAMEPLAKGDHPARVAVYGPLKLVSLVSSSGVETLSGLTLYPDRAVWQTLAPDQERVWNNYEKYVWRADATADPAVLEPVEGSVELLRIDPCAPQVLALHIDWVVSTTRLSFSCLLPVDSVRAAGATVYRYRVAGS